MSLGDIKEIVIDEESKTATVHYTIRAEPVEPLRSILCRRGIKCKKRYQEEAKMITLKKDAKGWIKEGRTKQDNSQNNTERG
jgi:hypothetical protein